MHKVDGSTMVYGTQNSGSYRPTPSPKPQQQELNDRVQKANQIRADSRGQATQLRTSAAQHGQNAQEADEKAKQAAERNAKRQAMLNRLNNQSQS